MNISSTNIRTTLAEMNVRNPVYSLIRSKAGNYLILSKLEIPTLPLLGHTKNAILLPNVETSTEYRLGRESDLNDPQVARGIAKWYRELHDKGKEYLADTKAAMYDETDVFTLANMEIVAEKTGTKDNMLWRSIFDNYGIIRSKIDALPRTLTYNDFYYTNLIVAKDHGSAFMFDYNLLGKGMAYGDIRNVTSSLSYEAAIAFKDEYGIDGLDGQAKADALISPLVTLYFACECEKFPSWANESLEELKKGVVMRHLNDWLNLSLV